MKTNLHHCILHQLIQVLVPFMRVLVVKIATHREHDVVGAVVTSLKEDHLDERLHSLINVVVKQTLVILEVRRGREREGEGKRKRKRRGERGGIRAMLA